MKREIHGVALVALGFLFSAVPALAHHSFAAEFDADKKITVTGTLTKVDWINPHIHLAMDVKDDNGNVVPWDVETFNPAWLHKAGIDKDMFKPGDVVSVLAYVAKDGTKNLVFAHSFKFADGRTIHVMDDNVNPNNIGRQ